MTATTEKELKIASSQELFVEAIKTLPLIPEQGDITFSADGLYQPLWWNINEDKRSEVYNKHIKECESKDIIPFSECKLRYSSDYGGFLLEKTWNEAPTSILNAQERTIVSLIRGSRIHSIHLDLGRHMKGKALQNLKDNLLEPLLQNGYHIREGNLWLSSWYGGDGYIKGSRPDSNLNFDSLEGSLELRLGSIIKDTARDAITKWFDNLNKKYSN